MVLPRILALAYLFFLAFGSAELVEGQERSGKDLGRELIATLRVASDAEIATVRSAVTDQLNVVQADLSGQAIGVVLRSELQVERLAGELTKLRPDPGVLRIITRGLRRQLTGRVHDSVTELRKRVQQLAVLMSLTPDRMDEAVKAVEFLTTRLDTLQRIEQGVTESEIRGAFEMLAALHPSPSTVNSLRTRLSVANHRVQINRDYVAAICRKTFELPLNTRENTGSGDVTAIGRMHVSTSVELPPSIGQSQIRVLVTGNGQAAITAMRDKAYVQASSAMQLRGSQLIALKPEGITGARPVLQAQFCTRLSGICLQMLFGNCNITRRIASRTAQDKLSQSDGPAARKFETTVLQRVEDEGYDIADKINQLIGLAFWEKLRALDIDPDLRLGNDEQGIRADATYARYEQLGAVTPVPAIPPEIERRLDVMTFVHESMVNNSSDRFSGMRLDEAMIRALWEEQFKLTSDEWTTLPVGRVTVRATLATENPLELRFAAQGIDLVLRVASCELDGAVRDAEPREFRLRYQLVLDESGARFVRQEVAPTAPLPADKAVVWQEVLGRFFGQSIRPMAKFESREVPQSMHVEYLKLDGGWLIIGAARTPDVTSPAANATVKNATDKNAAEKNATVEKQP